jgi:hypothetical protein
MSFIEQFPTQTRFIIVSVSMPDTSTHRRLNHANEDIDAVREGVTNLILCGNRPGSDRRFCQRFYLA